MAKAPATRKPTQSRNAAKGLITVKLRLRDKTVEFPLSLSIDEKFAVRAATGMPAETFLNGDRFGEDSLCVLWWLGRRANGEPNLPWQTSKAEWPTDLKADDVDLSLVEDDGEPTDDPGKSAPA